MSEKKPDNVVMYTAFEAHMELKDIKLLPYKTTDLWDCKRIPPSSTSGETRSVTDWLALGIEWDRTQKCVVWICLYRRMYFCWYVWVHVNRMCMSLFRKTNHHTNTYAATKNYLAVSVRGVMSKWPGVRSAADSQHAAPGLAKCHSDSLTSAWNPGTLTNAAQMGKR